MSVRIVPYGDGSWEVGIRLRLPNGQRHREWRVLLTVSTSAKRWGHDRERHLLQHVISSTWRRGKSIVTRNPFEEQISDVAVAVANLGDFDHRSMSPCPAID